MATWPSALKVNRAGYRETPPDRVIRTQMEAGIDKVRRRTINVVRPIEFSLFLDSDDIATLDAFYLTNAALRFDFTDPRTDTAVKARFREPPSYTLKDTMYDVTVKLEILPL